MSDLKYPGFQSSDIISALGTAFSKFSEQEKQAQIKKTKGLFQFDIKNAKGEVACWTIDLKKTGTVTKGPPPAGTKPDVILSISDADFVKLATGKENGQKLFMGGKLKAKGNIMLATKLDGVLKAAAPPKAKM
ncbi:sterol-binding-like protein [Mycena floridula]|nr:sterol-binding-like protein [Mycena floridula]